MQQAQGALLRRRANFANATAQRARTQELVKTDAASRALLDERVAEEKSAQGEVVIADANLKTANVNLGYTEITAPITGEVGRTKLTKGNVVGPGQRAADRDRQPRPDVCDVSGQPARVPESPAAGRDRKALQAGACRAHPVFRWLDLRPDRPDKLRRCDGGSRDRYRDGARDLAQPEWQR